MIENKIKNNAFYSYFLGTLNQQEQEQLEEEYFSQPERMQEFWAIFDEMAECFFHGELEAQDAQNFSRQLQAKPYLWARSERLYGLFQVLNSSVQDPPLKQEVAASNIAAFTKWFVLPTIQWGAVTVCLLLLIIGGYLVSRKAKNQTDEIAQASPITTITNVPAVEAVTPMPTAQPSTSLTPIKPRIIPRRPTTRQASDIINFYVLREGTRASREVTKLIVPAPTQTIALYFEVEDPFPAAYQSIVKTSTDQIFKSFTNLKVQQQNNLAFVVLRLDVKEIPDNQFTVQINYGLKNKVAQPLVSQLFQLEKQ